MSDYIASLEAALRDAAAREYPALQQRMARSQASPGTRSSQGRSGWWQMRRRWWRSPLVLLLAVIVGGSTAAAIVMLSRNSAPLTGSVPSLTSRLRYDIPLTPDLEAGDAGWCSYPIFSITGTIDSAGGGTCSPAVPAEATVISLAASPSATSKRYFASRIAG